MKVNKIVKHSTVDGEGIRTTIFFQGCPHKCKRCQNPDTWDFSKGDTYTPKELFIEIDNIIKNDKFNDGLSLSGGDPLFQYDLYKFLQIFKSYYPDKTIWCWTGCTIEEIQQSNILNYIDVLIDGKFKYKLTPTKKLWRGSDNQILYKKVNDKWKKID